MHKKHWFEARPGQTSAIRVMAVPGFYYCLANAGAASIKMVVTNNPVLMVLVAAWIGFAGVCLTGKAVQKKMEVPCEIE